MQPTGESIRLTRQYGAPNYAPLPVAIARAQGAWVEDAEGRRYLDMLSAYSALNLGHRHPRVIEALLRQAGEVTLTSRAFYDTQLGPWLAMMADLTGKARVLPMNTGAEAVESAVKIARRWAYEVKGVPLEQAEIIVCEGNFHGRTLSVTSFSSNPEYKRSFGPFTPGFRMIPYGDADALEQALTPHTAAFLVEPIQGEAGIRLPPDGYLQQAAALCRAHGALLIADEIQTGLGRTGKLFACQWEGVEPDLYVLGKALGGGVLPISAVCGDAAVLDVLEPGSHGSTFGGNPLACAVSLAAVQALQDERLCERSAELGAALLAELRRALVHPRIREVRGRGLFIGIELAEPARPICEQLLDAGLLTKDTHVHTVRLAPPLVLSDADAAWALERLVPVLNQA